MDKNSIPGAEASDKAHTFEDARKWAEQHLTPGAADHLLALADEEFNITQILYVAAPGRDGPERRLADVLIYSDDEGAWFLFDSGDSGGKLKKFSTERTAFAAVRWLVWNAQTRDGDWMGFHAG